MLCRRPVRLSHAALRRLSTGGAASGVVVHPEVKAALAAGRAVVALESTIISHGMPYPDNLDCARKCEAAVRANGAVPATVAVIGGVPCVGLDDDALDYLARAGHACTKTSRRDMASVVARGADGATTVAGTMVLAQMAGIEVFATGGIGGVHRGAETSMDISADLTELGRTPIAVVCAGVKSILDIGLTLEYLETQGVAVATIGSEVFPSFFTVSSGFASPATLPDPAAAAAQLDAAARLGLQSGTLLAVPNPSPPQDEAALESAVATALGECEAAGVSGKDVTPFLLARVTELTGGDSLASNVELVLNNSAVAAQVAVALSEIRAAAGSGGSHVAGGGGAGAAGGDDSPSSSSSSSSSTRVGAPVVIGGGTTDITSRPKPGTPLIPLTSSPGIVTQTMGGVGRGIAEALGQAGWKPLLVSAVGSDLAGEGLIAGCEAAGIATEGVLRDQTGERSAVYAALHDGGGELSAAIGKYACLYVLHYTTHLSSGCDCGGDDDGMTRSCRVLSSDYALL
jgi:pseudouridine-5'-phosphate glycosidase